MVRIAPSMVCADIGHLIDQARELEQAGADIFHVDVMDGRFVKNFALNQAVVAALAGNTRVPVETHLLVSEPDQYIDTFAEAGSSIITFHVESCPDPHRVIGRIKESGAKACVALNPPTDPSTLQYLFGRLDSVLAMGTDPGFRGQGFISEVLGKISALRSIAHRHGNRFSIEVDGGVYEPVIPSLVQAGADVLVVGAVVFDRGKSLKESFALVRELAVPGHRCQKEEA